MVYCRDVDYGDVEEDQELVRVFTTFEESGVEYVVRIYLRENEGWLRTKDGSEGGNE
jgi:hypothetical protein